MSHVVESPFLVPFDGSFRVKKAATAPGEKALDKKERKERQEKLVEELDDLQQRLYADNRFSLLLIFQAMDAAGKDSTIRAVMRGVNPAGCQVYSFKQPSAEELEHDFLWRATCRLPEKGRIGIFNRSYYEDVLVVRVHPELLRNQGGLPKDLSLKQLWEQRFESIVSLERHLARNGTLILKFWLNVSKEEQRQRFLSRIAEPEKNWKFSSADIAERGHWRDYMAAYEEALNATSRPWAPWYAIPADDKPYMRLCVAGLIVKSLKKLGLSFPRVDDAKLRTFEQIRQQLENEI